MKVKRMRITHILRRIWLFSENKITSSESFSKQPTQLIIVAHNCHTSTSLVKTLGLFSQKREKRKKNNCLVFSCTQKVVKQKCENDVLAPGFQKKGKEKEIVVT